MIFKKAKSIICFLLFGILFSLSVSGCGEAENTSEYVSNYTYDKPTGEIVKKKLYCNSDYFAFDNETALTVLNTDGLGILSFDSNVVMQKDEDNIAMYGVDKPVSLSYTVTYDVKIDANQPEKWHLQKESKKEIKGYKKLSGSVGNGLLLIEKSYDNVKYENAVSPVVNFYSGYSGNVRNFYTLDYADIVKGTYYKVTFAYSIGRQIGTKGWFIFARPNIEYKRYLETYNFYIVEYNKTVLIHNLDVDLPTVSNEETLDLELLSQTETLSNGDTTIGGFSIDKVGRNINVYVSKNGGSPKPTEDGETFTENGYYSISTLNVFGDEETTNVYVFDGGIDCGYSTYFGDSFVNGQRVFRFSDYPSYAKGLSINVEETPEYTPPLYGQLINITNYNVVLDFEGKTTNEIFKELPAGEYIGEFYSGKPTSGSCFHYVFHFNVVDSEATPYLNKYNLDNELSLSSFKAKHYEVTYQMTSGGYISVCFSEESHEDALNYAYEIEKRFIEQSSDGLFYKSPNNPNIKIKYKDYIELTDILYRYAEKNVSIAYFNPLEPFSYRTISNSELYSLEKLNLNQSIKVFPSIEEREKMRTPIRYLNNFTFIKVADYDVTSVVAYCYADNKTIELEFDKPISKQLTKNSKYTITEINSYGLTNVYDAYYYSENTSQLKFKVGTKNQTKEVIVGNNNHGDITADYVKLTDFINEFDEETLLTISAPGVYSYEGVWNVSELKNVVLYKKGTYSINCVDRFGYAFAFNIKISGDCFFEDVVDEEKETLTDKYNKNHTEKIEASLEEEIVTRDDLANLIAMKVEKKLFSKEDYNEYLDALTKAKNVVENPSSTRSDISKAYALLKIAMGRQGQGTINKTSNFFEFVKANVLVLSLGFALFVAIIIIIVLAVKIKRGW